jgi:hypothetical protein
VAAAVAGVGDLVGWRVVVGVCQCCQRVRLCD